jgi:hypothetical protein
MVGVMTALDADYARKRADILGRQVKWGNMDTIYQETMTNAIKVGLALQGRPGEDRMQQLTALQSINGHIIGVNNTLNDIKMEIRNSWTPVPTAG